MEDSSDSLSTGSTIGFSLLEPSPIFINTPTPTIANVNNKAIVINNFFLLFFGISEPEFATALESDNGSTFLLFFVGAMSLTLSFLGPPLAYISSNLAITASSSALKVLVILLAK